ncbi:MAG: YceI family protein [Casimicrobiaceae bacterium]
MRVGPALSMVAGALFVSAQAMVVQAAPESYRIETELSSTEFAVVHLGISKQRGHFGRTEGSIVLGPENHTGTFDLTVDATSVDTGWGVRDAWLRGEDMFDVARFPAIRFQSSQLVFNQERLIGIAGLLTLHGVTRPVVLKMQRMQCGVVPDSGREGCGAGASSSIKRSDFGLTYAMGLVGDDIDLTFDVVAYRAR